MQSTSLKKKVNVVIRGDFSFLFINQYQYELLQRKVACEKNPYSALYSVAEQY